MDKAGWLKSLHEMIDGHATEDFKYTWSAVDNTMHAMWLGRDISRSFDHWSGTADIFTRRGCTLKL